MITDKVRPHHLDLAQAGRAEKATEYLRKAGQHSIEHSANAEGGAEAKSPSGAMRP